MASKPNGHRHPRGALCGVKSLRFERRKRIRGEVRPTACGAQESQRELRSQTLTLSLVPGGTMRIVWLRGPSGQGNALHLIRDRWRLLLSGTSHDDVAGCAWCAVTRPPGWRSTLPLYARTPGPAGLVPYHVPSLGFYVLGFAVVQCLAVLL